LPFKGGGGGGWEDLLTSSFLLVVVVPCIFVAFQEGDNSITSGVVFPKAVFRLHSRFIGFDIVAKRNALFYKLILAVFTDVVFSAQNFYIHKVMFMISEVFNKRLSNVRHCQQFHQ
jgi:hypothetical protein